MPTRGIHQVVELSPFGHAELGEAPVQVGGDGAVRKDQALCDLAVGQALDG
jgi:hypothetical protein